MLWGKRPIICVAHCFRAWLMQCTTSHLNGTQEGYLSDAAGLGQAGERNEGPPMVAGSHKSSSEVSTPTSWHTLKRVCASQSFA